MNNFAKGTWVLMMTLVPRLGYRYLAITRGSESIPEQRRQATEYPPADGGQTVVNNRPYLPQLKQDSCSADGTSPYIRNFSLEEQL
jgi:hypothetical protein